jgi:hypothetical protein
MAMPQALRGIDDEPVIYSDADLSERERWRSKVRGKSP